ncbi:hypothetical protein [Dyadobacter psychrotolerans]|uniref:Uncharacterized protein n=1 Tax=Dyadobacter psychrotolerans TaxID=2541721 RepID=A0A4R5D5C9_9BACT|nr:hypothetical protein [Dyadobacter psychrotolerans]TDE08669.1 hypothetical protein E0F88_32075 [Dyadobacter psychrotolerans]
MDLRLPTQSYTSERIQVFPLLKVIVFFTSHARKAQLKQKNVPAEPSYSIQILSSGSPKSPKSNFNDPEVLTRSSNIPGQHTHPC